MIKNLSSMELPVEAIYKNYNFHGVINFQLDDIKSPKMSSI